MVFIHDGRANYPSIGAFRELWRARLAIEEMTLEAAGKADLSDAICWYMMGFYPRKLPAALTVHDYKSLSLGRFSAFKDFLKFRFNAKPDLRILKQEIKATHSFRDDVPEVIQDIGVPDSILSYRQAVASAAEYDFCYIGAISRERRIHLMIDSFLSRFAQSKTLLMMGEVEPIVRERYRANTNIIFTGRLTQPALFENMNKCAAVACYFPNHFPHIVQTPTKLLEAAAIGSRILANEQPMNRVKASEFGMQVRWGEAADMFRDCPDQLDWADNRQFDPAPMLTSVMSSRSGLTGYIENVLATGALTSR
ncbi:glycosyltransferase family 1 protein [uncultured Ramlibacter sp.]|uniref:glycosyltransferase family 1 protein n=1 Tax=uncultured Ramlibacter sp. TaxID=260755 RepID=UPI0026201E49|nr:glycosyltransferase family 1 protein [uncultured Ramlibacter sp.]